jgi:hypothetical protein
LQARNESHDKPFRYAVSFVLYDTRLGLNHTVEEVIEWADREMYKVKKRMAAKQ